MNKQKIGILIVTVIMLLAILILGPLDCFSHGYFCDEIHLDEAAADIKDHIRLEDGDFEMQFSPVKDHFVGFELNLVNQPEDNSGTLLLTVLDKNGKRVEEITVDLSKVAAGSWYKTYTKTSLKKGQTYTLRFSALQCATAPYLQIIDPDYLGAENISGDVLLGYAYAASTFTFQNKVLIVLFLIAFWGFLCSGFMKEEMHKKTLYYAAAFLMATAVLSWNYMYNSMDSQNDTFASFQADSGALVTSVIMAQHYGVWFDEAENGWGLGNYRDKAGNCYGDGGGDFVTDDNWNLGYSRTEAAVAVAFNEYTQAASVVGNYLLFSNGDMFRITDVSADAMKIILYLNAERVLNPSKYGDLSDALFLDENQGRIENGELKPYTSQFGLQGKVFKQMACYMDYKEAVSNLHLLCAIATAVVFTLIVFLLFKKYNPILAGVFFVTFWLSPWIVNFAKNLYWVEFTWFIPMAVGLFCSWKINDKKCRIFSYAAAMIAIAVKCLCGYEYISVVMMGLIAFLLVDFLSAIAKGDKTNAKLIFRVTFIIGMAALAGFMTAVCFHAVLKGDGSMMEGIKNIFKQDVLRRTIGADYNEFNTPEYVLSFNASIWEICCRYFHFSTEIIVGIHGNLFPLICLIPLCIFAYEYRKKALNHELLFMYIVFFLTSLSWFCLAKSHSGAHFHMNYVLWYFGYVQTCLYVIVYQAVSAYEKLVKASKKEKRS